jgi:hypothetical protein
MEYYKGAQRECITHPLTQSKQTHFALGTAVAGSFLHEHVNGRIKMGQEHAAEHHLP